ncbi:MAG: CHRD domain-containing protein [Chloroflexi bacterium]|nr:CHRD domain-containing protein [Chloroflexota bacterium]
MRTPFRFTLALATTLGIVASLALVGGALAAPTTLTATLAGVIEGDNPGDPDGAGTASLTLDPATGEVCWDLTATGTMAITQSHIHTGAAGVSGGVLVPLDIDGFTGSSEGCVSGQPAAAINDILANPAGFYVNLHTSDFAAGAIRGQLAAAAAQPNTAVSEPVGTSPIVAIGLVLLGLAVVNGVRTLRPSTRRD